MILEEFLEHLDGVKQTGRGFIALCPAHSDKKRSLSISEGDNSILIKCFAGCSASEICAAMNLKTSDLFDSQTTHKPKTEKMTPRGVAPIAIYDYCDEHGELLYQNVRFEPKDFRQRRPDGKSGWIYNLGDVRRVPYCLPELTSADEGATIFLCEGEKDADNLRGIGLTASSFKNWKPEFNRYIENRDVVILADHDTSGVNQANEAAKIVYAIATSLKMIDLFGGEPLSKKHGKDVSDWLEIQRQDFDEIAAAETLCTIADYTDDWMPPTETADEYRADETDDDFTSLLVTKTANQHINEAKQTPPSKMLFDEFFYEGELAILFADTGVGKSVLAVHIADSITKGKSIAPFTLEAGRQTVLYFDCELSQKQFEKRYALEINGELNNHYVFDDSFFRAVINRDAGMPKRFKTFEEYLVYSLEYEIAQTGTRILIVDNITYLRTQTETAKDALPLMKELNRLKDKYKLSIKALAHTPKRDASRPLTLNDLQGSKMLSNFADSVFAIGSSAQDTRLRYLKQLKVRSAELKYHAENVAVFELAKPDNFLAFSFLSFGNEHEHLQQRTNDERNTLVQKAKELSAEGKSQRNIAETLNIAVGSVNKYLKQSVHSVQDVHTVQPVNTMNDLNAELVG